MEARVKIAMGECASNSAKIQSVATVESGGNVKIPEETLKDLEIRKGGKITFLTISSEDDDCNMTLLINADKVKAMAKEAFGEIL